MTRCYDHIPSPQGEKRCPATATTYSRNGVPVCKAHDDKAVTK